jgi:hypothetical protein
LVLFLNLIWEGTCIGFFIDLFLQCQVPRTTPCLLSHLSHPISRHLIFAHEFKFFIKTTSVFENFKVFSSGFPGRNIRPLGRNIRWGRIIRPPGQIIRSECRPGIKRGWVGLPPGSSNPNPPCSLLLPPPTLRHRRRSSGHPLGRISPGFDLLHLWRAFTKPFSQWTRVLLISPL